MLNPIRINDNRNKKTLNNSLNDNQNQKSIRQIKNKNNPMPNQYYYTGNTNNNKNIKFIKNNNTPPHIVNNFYSINNDGNKDVPINVINVFN